MVNDRKFKVVPHPDLEGCWTIQDPDGGHFGTYALREDADYDCTMAQDDEDAPEQRDREMEIVNALAETTKVLIHYGDPDAHAVAFNEGFDTAHRQGVGGDLSRTWLRGKLTDILDRLGGTIRQGAIDEIIDEIVDTVVAGELEDLADTDERPDPERGMYGKYHVVHLHDPIGKHTHCRYFVLDPQHDPFATPALEAYATAARGEYPYLAKDIDMWLKQVHEL